MKGQSAFLTHAILMAFIIFLIFIIINTFMTLKDEYQNFAADNEMGQVCLMLESGIEKIIPRTDFRPVNSANEITISLPERLSGSPYIANFRNKTIEIKLLDAAYNTTCSVGFNYTYSGFSSGGQTKIKFLRNKTSERIEMSSL